MAPEAMFGPLDVLYDYAAYVLLVLVLVNSVTRILAHNRHVRQYRDDGAEAVERFLPHDVSNVLLVLGAFYYMTVSLEPGVVASVLVVGVVIADFFEFEARKVEARKDDPLDVPKAAITAWVVAALYIAYRSLFFLVEPLWDVVAA